MKGIILAGGYATRLLPLTENTPKHLLPINSKPMIEYLMEQLESVAIDEYFLVTNDKFAKQFEEWASQSKWAEEITIVNDGTTSNEDRLGSLGDILYTLDMYNIFDDFFVLGADNITDFDFQQLLDVFDEKKSPVVGLYDLGSLEHASEFGVVTIDESKKIVDFVEKPAQPQSTLISMLFYVLPQSSLPVIRHLVEIGNGDKAGNLIQELLNEQDVYSIVHTGYWFDIGTKEMYKETQDFFLNKYKI